MSVLLEIMGYKANRDAFLRAYINRTRQDGGLIYDTSQTQLRRLFDDNAKYGTNLKLCWNALGAYKPRTSGLYNYATKAYDMSPSVVKNDLTQTTAANQPPLQSIAPSERPYLINPNGGSNYMTHPAISFGASDAWTVECVVNWSGVSDSRMSIAGKENTSCIGLRTGATNILYVIDEAGTLFGTSISTSELVGKSVIVQISHINGNLYFYINGVFKGNVLGDPIITFSQLLRGRVTFTQGKLYHYSIFSKALTSSEVASRSALLHNMFPEIETVPIGTQQWALRNYEAICTPQGNLIPEVQSAVTWATSQTLYDNAYAAASGTVEQKTYAGVKAAAMWRSPNNDVALQVIYGKIYNGFAKKLLAMDIAYYNAANPSATWGYGIPTQAELDTMMTTISDNAESLKAIGTTYWTTPNAGTNTTGMTLLPAGYIKEDGTYAGLGTTTILGIEDDMDMPKLGTSLRLIKR